MGLKTEYTLEEILAMLLSHEQQIRAEVDQETVSGCFGVHGMSVSEGLSRSNSLADLFLLKL